MLKLGVGSWPLRCTALVSILIRHFSMTSWINFFVYVKFSGVLDLNPNYFSIFLL